MSEPLPADIMRRLRPIPTYRDHPATTGHDIAGVDPDGTRRVIDVTGSDRPVLLLFLSSTCLGCADLWAGADDLRRALGGAVRVVVVTRGPEAEDAAAVTGLTGDVVMSTSAYRDYGIGGPPYYALVLGPEVRDEGVAWGVTETAEAVRRALEGPAAP